MMQGTAGRQRIRCPFPGHHLGLSRFKGSSASRRRGIPTDEGELWEILRVDAERAAAGEEMLRGFLDLVVLRHDGFASGLGLLLANKLAEYSMPAERLERVGRISGTGVDVSQCRALP
jgi:hypothetical protein